VSGILTPVINGKRFFMDISTRETFSMEADEGEADILAVGKYLFSKKSFDKAKHILLQSAGKPAGWLVIDEIGPLELKGEGFYDVIRYILDRAEGQLKIIFVIRESILPEVLAHFHITGHSLFE